jgi:hypothetical protein
MDTLVVTMDVYYVAIGRHFAEKEGLFAVKGGAITAKGGSIVRMAGFFAVKCRDCERAKSVFCGDERGLRSDVRTQCHKDTVLCGNESASGGNGYVQCRDGSSYHREVRVHCRDVTGRPLVTPAL